MRGWAPLYTLVLAQGASPAEADSLRGRLEGIAAARRASTDLAALATAVVEIDGADGVAWLEGHYLADPTRSADEVDAVATGLGVQGSEDRSELRRRIVEAYRTLLLTHPGAAGRVAMDLFHWQDWTLADAVAEVRSSTAPRDFGTEYALRLYLAAARNAGTE